jgi:hypothetical protein
MAGWFIKETKPGLESPGKSCEVQKSLFEFAAALAAVHATTFDFPRLFWTSQDFPRLLETFLDFSRLLP